MRLFAAIFIPEKALDEIVELQSKLRSMIHARASWTRREKMHITLRFFGDYDVEEASRKISQALANESVFPVTLSSLSGFPSPMRARVAFLDHECEPLVRISTLLMEEGDRKPHPHLTLARFYRPLRLPALSFEPINFIANEVALVNSILHGENAGYHVLQTWKLGGDKG
ncbi:MAG TPA: RNA 2',3'-cyclic phosphodiesterase [Fimbriimonadales bacterium]|nr:RNA 2',3'-cyclic phosphodiesterase [Fimbriimonadales bacterium]